MPRRSALPLPRYVERRRNLTENKWSYLFNVPSWAKLVAPDDPRGACPLRSKSLGTDYEHAVARAENILLPQLDAWRTRNLSDLIVPGIARGTFDWMVSIYRSSPQYTKLSARQKKNFEYGLGIASRHPLKNDASGRERFGQLSLMEISEGVVDQLYAKVKQDLVPVLHKESREQVLDEHGQPVFASRPRLRRAQEVIKSCRRAWNVARRKEPQWVPSSNPFEKAEVEAPKSGTTVPATWEQTVAFVRASDDAGEWSIGTAAMVAFCWFQRQEHIMGVPREDGRITGLLWADYRPSGDPDAVLVRHPKTDEVVSLPLYTMDGLPLFPELMDRLDGAQKRGR